MPGVLILEPWVGACEMRWGREKPALANSVRAVMRREELQVSPEGFSPLLELKPERVRVWEH